MNRVRSAIRHLRCAKPSLSYPPKEDLWLKKTDKKPFRKEKFNELDERYEVIHRATEDDEWHPANWVGRVDATNKLDYIALPIKIEMCLANELDSRFYTSDQNWKFKDASIHFEHMYNRRQHAFKPLTNKMIEKRFAKVFGSSKLTRENKPLLYHAIGTPGLDKAQDGTVGLSQEQSRAVMAANKKLFQKYLTTRSAVTTIEYDEVITKIWAKTKTTFSYAATFKVLSELKAAGFDAETMLDFGCGIGPGLWAANEVWKDTLRMYDGVDESHHMLRMANYVVTGGDEDCLTDGIRWRRYIPEGTAFAREQYNIVLVANTLGDLSSRKERLNLIDRLWGKVNYHGGALVLIENGNLPGHELIQEARSHLIDNHQNAYTVAPCGHNSPCGLFRPNDGEERRIKADEYQFRPVCSFPIVYERPAWSYHHRKRGPNSRVVVREKFNYVVIAKNVTKLPPAMQFPRVIGKGKSGLGYNVAIACVNGTPIPITAKRDRESHETNLQVRRLRIGDTMPVVERDGWQPTESDFAHREILRIRRGEMREMKKKMKSQSNNSFLDDPIHYDQIDLPFASTPFQKFSSMFMEKDEFPDDEDI